MTLEQQIQEILTEVEKSTGKVQQELFKEIQVYLKDLDLDAVGNIKPTIKNIKTIKKISNRLESVILKNPDYLQAVKSTAKGFDEITKIQAKVTTEAFGSANIAASLTEIKDISIDQVIADLTESGIKANVIDAIETTLIDNVKTGNSFSKMTSQIKDLLDNETTASGGKLSAYSTQIVTDGLYQYAGNYDQLVGQAYKTKWYKYVGSEIDTTRPLCAALVEKKYIHESELKGIVDGRVDGKQISVAGQNPSTTSSNFIVYRGGYNCRHRMIPVPEASIPKELREKYADK
jgi:hypothetical protein